MAKNTLAVSVTLRDPKTNKLVSFVAGDKPPKWAKDAISNPAAWGKGKADAKPTPGVRRPAAKPDTGSEPAGGTDPEDQGAAGAQDPQDGAGDPDDGSDGTQVPEPPRAGKGSGIQAWQDHADLLGIEYDEDATRDDLIELVDAHNAGQE